MRTSSTRHHLIDVCALLAMMGVMLACSPHRVPSSDTKMPNAEHHATVFTDAALYKQMCTQADSGLAPASGRCTPRDQSVQLVRPLAPSQKP